MSVLKAKDPITGEWLPVGAPVGSFVRFDIEQNLNPLQQAQSRANIGVDVLIGDIETALDSIIAIQNSLIGGDGT